MRSSNTPVIQGDPQAKQDLFLPDPPHLFWPPEIPNNPNGFVPGLPGEALFEYLIRNMLVMPRALPSIGSEQ
mgnify:CR=1 FL=1